MVLESNKAKDSTKHTFKQMMPSGTLTLVQIVGPSLMYDVIKKLGGKRVKLPLLKTFDSEKYRDKLKIGDVAENLRIFAEIIGLNKLRKLCMILSGELVIVSKSTMDKWILQRNILKDFKGDNFAELRRKYGVTDQVVRGAVYNDPVARRKYTRKKRDKERRRQK